MESRFKLKEVSLQSCCAILVRVPVIKTSSVKKKTELYTTGPFIMRYSSPSQPPSIKAQHRLAKRRAIRRRRLDLNCGCSIFLHINCHDHGFTHRGEHHCASGREFRFYLGGSKSPLFQDHHGGGSTIHSNKDLPHTSQSQPQRAESVGSPQSLLQLPSLDDINDSFWDDIFK
ncbi:transcription activator protein [Macroptilium yellow mosaic virus]|uniref:Transcriptional activator protein n=1 Tax=Macroptilium yellow mosaic virus TaxID=169865 RepID=B2X136_9GEMI|nr:transcription activator protein [Macroptilium yellow mosaic virus]ABV53457.1 transcription activator protein [Macroptilium yellow mosaic virus]